MKYTKAKRVLSALTACLMLSAGAGASIPFSVRAAGNIISNSTFESGISGWAIYKESGGAATLSANNGKLALNVSSIGSLAYAVQLYYDIVPLYQNGVYRMKYDISCSTNRTVECMIQENGGTYQAYTWKKLEISPSVQAVDYQFTMTEETDIMAKLAFNCGDEGEALGAHTIYLDNVSLELVDDSRVNYESSQNYEAPIITDQVGYRCDAKKTAVFRKISNQKQFTVATKDGKTVYTGSLSEGIQNSSANETNYIGDFSEVKTPGTYVIKCDGLDASYPFTISDTVYNNLLDESVRMLYMQRCGCAVSDSKFSHPACHTGLATVYGTGQKIDVSGGWHDAGDYGRYIVPAAKTIADLLYAYDTTPDLYGDATGIPESGNGVPDILDEARYELEWMFKMQAADGGVYHKVTCATFPGYVMPQDETKELIVTPVSSTATADFCASMAMAYEYYLDFDKTFANKCLTAATKSWSWLQSNPNFKFQNPSDISTGEYGDKSDADERYWAAAQLYRATGESSYLSKLESMTAQDGLDWATVGDYGNIALLTMDNINKQSSAYTKALSKVISQADTFQRNTANSPYGVAIIKYNWGSNMTIANAGMILALAYRLTNKVDYLNAAEANLHYLLGTNPLGTCFVTGYGTVSPKTPHHRPSMAVGSAMPGMLVGGVNSSLEDSAAKAYCASSPAAKCYVDNSESYSTNEITIYWNSPLTCLLSLTEKSQPIVQKPAGDVNADGSFTMADVVLLQRYLMGETVTLNDWAAGDLNDDKTLNAIDLTAMKRMLLNLN